MPTIQEVEYRVQLIEHKQKIIIMALKDLIKAVNKTSLPYTPEEAAAIDKRLAQVTQPQE